MPSREELLQSIRPGMKLDRAFFLRIYGYEITWPGFAETALQRLSILGCIRAREYYDSVVQEYKTQHAAEMQDVSRWYRAEYEHRWERQVRKDRGERSKTRYQFAGFPEDW